MLDNDVGTEVRSSSIVSAEQELADSQVDVSVVLVVRQWRGGVRCPQQVGNFAKDLLGYLSSIISPRVYQLNRDV